MREIDLKYRTWFKGVPPKQIKLEVPGWAGEKTYASGQPYHCLPFIHGATYGLELVYQFDTEVKVYNDKESLKIVGDFSEESKGQPWDTPFSTFANGHFSMTSSLDIKTPEGIGMMILPHPRFYTDKTGEVPVPVCGMLEMDFWSRIFFVVFKNPINQTYVFRKGEPYASLIFVDKKIKYNIERMSPEETKERENLEAIISEKSKNIATRTWKTKIPEGGSFDNKYKVLSNMDRNGEDVGEYLKSLKKIKKIPKRFNNGSRKNK